jgi:hypothetical protein
MVLMLQGEDIGSLVVVLLVKIRVLLMKSGVLPSATISAHGCFCQSRLFSRELFDATWVFLE